MLETPKHKKSAKPAQNDQESFFKPRAKAKLKNKKPSEEQELDPKKAAEKLAGKEQGDSTKKSSKPDLKKAKELTKELLPDKEKQTEKEEQMDPKMEDSALPQKGNPELPADDPEAAKDAVPEMAPPEVKKDEVEAKTEEEPAQEKVEEKEEPVEKVEDSQAPTAEKGDTPAPSAPVVNSGGGGGAAPADKKGGEEKSKEEGDPEGKEGEGKEKGKGDKDKDPGPPGVVVNYENPPPVKDPQMDTPVDQVGEAVQTDEVAHNNLTGLAITAQQFRDQGKEAMDRADEQTKQRLSFESDIKRMQKEVKSSDKTLGKADTHATQREGNIAKMGKHLSTSKQRQASVAAGVGTPIASYNKEKGKAADLEKESSSLVSGSAKHNDPADKDSGMLDSKLKELSTGATTIAKGITGGGATANQLKQDAQTAKGKNTQSAAELKGAGAEVRKTKGKIAKDKGRNNKAKQGMAAIMPKLAQSKKQEKKMKAEGKSLMKTSFDIENETHHAQYFYYKDMKGVPGREGLLAIEVDAFEQELATMSGGEGLLFAYAKMETEETRDAFIQNLSPDDRILLSGMLTSFMANHDAWMQSKQEELFLRVEKKRGEKVGVVNEARNLALQKPLNRVTKNLSKVNKTGLFWTSMTQSLSNIWKGITSITWSDVGSFALAIVNPLETWRTISTSVMGIYNDLTDWGGFSKDPVGMILKKGSSVGVKLLTISGVITGVLGLLTIAAAIGAFFTAGALAPLAAWLASATVTMGTITFWIGVVTGVLSVLSGVKNIYDIHTAKTAEGVFQNTAELKKDAANTGLSILGIVGAKGSIKGGTGLKNMIGKYPKSFGKRMFLTMKGGLMRKLTWAPRVIKSLFRKETWQGLAASLKRFMSRNADEALENNRLKNNKKHSDENSLPDKAKDKEGDIKNDGSRKDKDGETINSSKEIGDNTRIPFEALNKRQKTLLKLLQEKGTTIIVPKKSVSMNDLLQLTKHTGDEFSMFTRKGERLIIRGFGSEIKVSKTMLDDILSGGYGKFSGHTHPPGSLIDPGPSDRPFLSKMNQKRSGIWGDTVDEPYVFGTIGDVDDKILQSEIFREKMAKYYGNL